CRQGTAVNRRLPEFEVHVAADSIRFLWHVPFCSVPERISTAACLNAPQIRRSCARSNCNRLSARTLPRQRRNSCHSLRPLWLLGNLFPIGKVSRLASHECSLFRNSGMIAV